MEFTGTYLSSTLSWQNTKVNLALSKPVDPLNMEVDQFALDFSYGGESSRLPLVDETSVLGNQPPKDRYIHFLAVIIYYR